MHEIRAAKCRCKVVPHAFSGTALRMKITMLAAVFVLLIQWNVRKRDQASVIPPLVKALAIMSVSLDRKESGLGWFPPLKPLSSCSFSVVE